MVRQVIELVNLAMMHTEDLLKSRRQILEEVKSVGDLSGLWSPLPNACGIGFGSVTSHDLDIGMGLEPRGHGLSGSIFQQVKGAPPLELDNDGAVAMAFAPRPIVQADDCRFWPLRQRHAAHASKEGVATAW